MLAWSTLAESAQLNAILLRFNTFFPAPSRSMMRGSEGRAAVAEKGVQQSTAPDGGGTVARIAMSHYVFLT